MARLALRVLCGTLVFMAVVGVGQEQTSGGGSPAQSQAGQQSAPSPPQAAPSAATAASPSAPAAPTQEPPAGPPATAAGATSQVSTGEERRHARAEQRTAERVTDERDVASMGIVVEQPKIYDDSLLQQMLKAAQARLLSLQALDQASILSHLGSVTGATQSISAFGLSVTGPTLPQVATTNAGPTNSTVSGTSDTTTTGASPGTSSTNSSQTTTTTPTVSTTTTTPQVSAPTVTVPAPSTSLPATYSVSASDVLNEQMQLTYEIANLQLLLEGSLSDWTIGTSNIVKPRVTLGFPITIAPDKRYKDATAVVEVEIEKDSNTQPPSSELPAIITLLPKEKTYNVARITDNSFAVSAGVATQAISVGGAYGRGTKTYYLVKDIDTVALTYKPTNPNRVGFMWQFRPVLGQRYVNPGQKQVFVQIAFPSIPNPTNFGKVYVRTYWKCYDRKNGYAKKIRPHSLQAFTDQSGWPIPYYSLLQNPRNFTRENLKDLGNGQVLVTLPGRYLGGTYIRIGSSFLADGNPAFRSQYQQIQFVATVADLATKDVALVSRDGTESPLILNYDKKDTTYTPALVQPSIAFTPVDDSNTLITATFSSINAVHDKLPLVMVLGGKVYGYADAPMTRADKTLTVVVPTSALLASPSISFRSLLTSPDYWRGAEIPVLNYPHSNQTPKLALLEQADDSAKYLLYGAALDKATVESPSGVSLTALSGDDGKTMRLVTLTKAQVKAEKQLVFKTSEGLRFALPFPAVDIPDTNKYNLKPVAAVSVGDDEVILQGDELTDLQDVTFNKVELKVTKQKDGKMVWVSGLKAAGVTAEAKKQTLTFVFKSGKVAVDLTVGPKS